MYVLSVLYVGQQCAFNCVCSAIVYQVIKHFLRQIFLYNKVGLRFEGEMDCKIIITPIIVLGSYFGLSQP